MNRAIVVLGMHRSGTSVVTKGLQACGVFIGDNFIESQPDNPTGFWEDREIVRINEALLALKGISYRDLALFEPTAFEDRPCCELKATAVAYIKKTFLKESLWGFKDPRTVRLLPFWQSVLAECGSEPSYLIALRNPENAASSLVKREEIDHETAHCLWLNYMIPFLSRVQGSPVAVLDYDRLLAEPKGELLRVSSQLKLPVGNELEAFCKEFVDCSLRHERPGSQNGAAMPYAAELTLAFYNRLDQLHESPPEAAFWDGWNASLKPTLEYIRLRGVLNEEKMYTERVLKSALRWQQRSWATRAFHKWRPPSRAKANPAPAPANSAPVTDTESSLSIVPSPTP